MESQFCRFKNYDLTYALYTKFPSWGLLQYGLIFHNDLNPLDITFLQIQSNNSLSHLHIILQFIHCSSSNSVNSLILVQSQIFSFFISDLKLKLGNHNLNHSLFSSQNSEGNGETNGIMEHNISPKIINSSGQDYRNKFSRCYNIMDNNLTKVERTEIQYYNDAALHLILIMIISFILYHFHVIIVTTKNQKQRNYCQLSMYYYEYKILLANNMIAIRPFQSYNHLLAYSKCKLMDFVPSKDKISWDFLCLFQIIQNYSSFKVFHLFKYLNKRWSHIKGNQKWKLQYGLVYVHSRKELLLLLLFQ